VAGVLLMLGWFSTPVADSDTFWLLKSGQFIVQRHSLPVPDPFAYTAYLGKPAFPEEETVREYNLKHEWLAEVLFYLVYAGFGFGGMVLVRSAMLCFFCGTAGLLVYRRTRNLYLALAAAALASFLSGVFTSDRPYQITNVLLAVTLLIMESRRGLWALPPIFLFWANCHGGYIMGLVVLGAYLADSLYQRWRGAPRADERRLWLVSAASFLVCGVNPNGFRGLTILLAYRHSNMARQLYEWQRPSIWPPTFLVFLLALALALLWRRRAESCVAHWLLVAAFGAAYLSAQRNTAMAGFILSWAIFSYFPWKPVLPAMAEAVVAGLLVAGLIGEVAHGTAFQFREAAWKQPSGAADFLLAHHVTGPMLNTWEKGGYLIWRLWPQEQVFIDGRQLNESVYPDYQRMVQYSPPVGGPSGKELLDKYGIEVILLNAFEANSGEPYMLPIALASSGQREWSLVYRDAQATVFMRHPPEGVQPLPPHEAIDNLETQCTTILENDRDRRGCARGLSRLFARAGDTDRARRWLAIYQQQP
jgi:hypothetical protein